MFAALFALVAVSVAPRNPDDHTLSQRYRAPEKSVWVFEVEGARIGEHASHYLGREDVAGASAHHFRGWVRLNAPGPGNVQVRFAADLWTDDHGHPLRFEQQTLVGETYAKVELAFEGGKAKAHILQGTSKRDVEVKADPATLLLANNFLSHIELALALIDPGHDASLPLLSGNTLQPLTYKLTAKGKFEEQRDGQQLTGEEYTDSLGERLRVVDGRLVEVAVAAQKLVIRRSDETFEPFTISPPAARVTANDFDGENVRIARGEGSIAGRITKPKGTPGKLPALFFVSGSGAQDRDGMSDGIDIGTHEILDRLTREGFLVLRVDDRGAGESSAPPENMSYDDLVGDARACVEFLARRDDVDAKRIVLVGHSEGGETVPLLAVENPSIAAIVLMAAPGRSVIDIMIEQNRMGLEQSGVKGAELEKQLGEVSALLRRLASDETIDPNSLPEDQRAILSQRAWIQGHARQDPIATVRKVRCPVLILQGAKDFQVSLERDARALEAALKDARHPDFELRAFPALDHLFKRSPGEKSEFADYMKDRRVDAEFLDVLCAWLRPRVKLEKR